MANNAIAEARLLETTHDLLERVKELNCLYGISRLREKPGISLDEILQGIVELIPPAWQYPQVTCAAVTFRKHIYKTNNFIETDWRQAEDIRVNGRKGGTVEVYYLEKKPEVFEGPFLKEERDLIFGIAERVGHIIESRIAEENLLKMSAKERRLINKLQQEMQSKNDFTRMLIHELKTPLTSLTATSQLLLEETKNTRLEKLAKFVLNGANGLNSRIDELNDVIRGEIGMLKLDAGKVNINGFITSIVDETRALAGQYGILIETELEKLPQVNADITRLRQIMLNLINNACLYAAEGGKITIRDSRWSNSAAVIEVQDYGRGIPQEEQRHLFKPLYMIHNQPERRGGLGIGLALCKMLVELHRGKIWYEGGDGKGSSFFFTLPIVK